MQFIQPQPKLKAEPFPGLMQHPKMLPPAPAPAAPPASGDVMAAPKTKKARATKKSDNSDPAPAAAPATETPRPGKLKIRKLL